MEKNLRKAYESPLAEEIHIIPENVLCGSPGTGGEGFDIEKEDL